MMDIIADGSWLPLSFAALMALAVLVYAVLDGYDIGVGLLSKAAKPEERDVMISSIGPFWDANETWLVLAVGLLLIAFPQASGVVLGELYLPVAVMLLGLTLRGVSFDFRVKAKADQKARWDTLFFAGSLLMAVSQGYMIAAYALGFEKGLAPLLFCLLAAVGAASAYGLIGASWLIMKTEGALQKKAVLWARRCLYAVAAALFLVALARGRLFSDGVSFVLPLLVLIAACMVFLGVVLRSLPAPQDKGCWKPFVLTVCLYLLSLIGLAYSFYPYIVPGRLTIVEAAAAPESLMVILIGALVVLPFLIGYTFFAYKIFHGKTRELTYE